MTVARQGTEQNDDSQKPHKHDDNSTRKEDDLSYYERIPGKGLILRFKYQSLQNSLVLKAKWRAHAVYFQAPENGCYLQSLRWMLS